MTPMPDDPRSDERFREVLENIEEGYYETDLKGRFVFVNEAMLRIIGLPRESLVGIDNRTYMDTASTAKVFAVFSEVYRTGQPTRVGPIPIQLRDGPPHWFEFSVALIRDAAGGPTGFRGLIHDITDIKQAELALRTTTSRLEGLLHAIPDIIYFKDAERRNQIVNLAFEAAFGLSQEAVAGKTDEELLPADLAAACRASDDIVLSTGRLYRFEEETKGPDGQPVHFDTIKAPITDPGGEIVGLIGVSRDITEHHEAEKRIQASEERFRSLYENATLGMYRTNPEGQILMANPALLRMLGYASLEELARRNIEADGFEPDYPRSAFKERMEQDGEIRGLEAAWKHRDGNTIYVRESARAIRDETGRIIRYEGTVEDITAQRLAQAELQASEERYRRLVENSLDAIYQTTEDGRILSANSAMQRMMGYETIGEYLKTDVHDTYADARQRTPFREAMAHNGEVRNMELLLRRKDGSTFYVLANANAVKDKDGRMIFEGILTDITAQKETERELAGALAEKDILIKEVHHRVKNNLQVISSLLNLQSRFLKHPDDVDLFKESQRRIRSMALIHEKLYQSKSLSRIEFSSYAKRLIENLMASNAPGGQRIGLRPEVEEVFLDIQTAIPLGLIVNELVMNALKHGFPDGRAGTVRLGLRVDEEGRIEMKVGDDGVGLPQGLDVMASDSMGMQIVGMLTDQLEGQLEIDRTAGTEFRLTFKELKYKPRL
ncbi:MAG: PAS domain S-box protein [Candidatus Aminicenantes bacterium]|nr:PAS domain S-box protein [Candidatus Aminicenantes bacterium]